MLKTSLKQIWSLNSAPQIIKLFGKCCKNYIFETELETTDYRFDLSLCVLKEEIDSLLLYWKQNDLRAIFEKDTDWKNIYRFCSEWEDQDSILSKHITNLWFEFDDLELKSLFPRPCLFFSPRHSNRSTIPDTTQNIFRLYDTALSTLYGNTLSDAIKRNIQRCIDALPGNGAIFQIGEKKRGPAGKSSF